MSKDPVEVATPKFALVTWVRKWRSRIAEAVECVWIISLCIVN